MNGLRILLIYLLVACSCEAQINFPFKWVSIPQEIKHILAEKYGNWGEGAANNAYNLIINNDVELQNGIYVYYASGPHFKRKCFVFYNKKLYVLDGDRDKGIDILKKDFAKCADSLHLNGIDSLNYINAITTFERVDTLKSIEVDRNNILTDMLKGEWFVQIAKITNMKEEKWYRTCGLTHALIRTNKQNYTLSFFHREKLEECDDITMHCHFDKFVIDEAYYYNKKIFLLMTRNNKDGTKLSFLISKNENSEF